MSRVLVIAPHPDDEVLGVGGTTARHAAEGDEVHVVIVTRGNPEVFDAAFIEQGREEARQAHALLGVRETHWGDFPAPGLDTVPHYRLVGFLRELLVGVQPSTVYLPHGWDVHNDHHHVYRAALTACRPTTGVSARRLLCYETLSETEWASPFGDEAFVPTVFIDISTYLEAKQKAMAAYRSQLQDFPRPRSLAAITALARLRGSTVGLPAAEAFMIVREIITSG